MEWAERSHVPVHTEVVLGAGFKCRSRSMAATVPEPRVVSEQELQSLLYPCEDILTVFYVKLFKNKNGSICFNFSIWEGEPGGFLEFKAILVYITSFSLLEAYSEILFLKMQE